MNEFVTFQIAGHDYCHDFVMHWKHNICTYIESGELGVFLKNLLSTFGNSSKNSGKFWSQNEITSWTITLPHSTSSMRRLILMLKFEFDNDYPVHLANANENAI